MISPGNADKVFDSLVSGLRSIGYRNGLLQYDYRFGDWFSRDVNEEIIDVATFGQLPISYESACFGVVKSPQSEINISRFRSLGAPIIFEVKESCIRQWNLSREDKKQQPPSEISFDNLSEHISRYASEWTPQSLLRAKNIGGLQGLRQLELFAGFIPLLEEQIREKLDPMLERALAAATIAYHESTNRPPDSQKLFRLIFSLLTAKVFHDREVSGFAGFDMSAGADAVLDAVSNYYKQNNSHNRVLNKHARNVAFEKIWDELNFRNLSVEVLAQMWSKTLVDADLRKQLGIHRTSRSIVKYIVDSIPFSTIDERLSVVEPCCGSSAFLIGAMNEIRSNLWGHSPEERHTFFADHLIGFEKDPFGVEISQLALTLADFPNPDGWMIHLSDVFKRGNQKFLDSLHSAGVVLCNPPFEDFLPDERAQYNLTSTKKPVELLNLVLDHLHPDGVIGFVLPRLFLDGQGYRSTRKRIAERFATIEITSLPDKAFEADHEVVLLIAKNALPHRETQVVHRKVADSREDWEDFAWAHIVSSEEAALMLPEDASKSLAVPDLKSIWDYLESNERLSRRVNLHRGIEWNIPLTKEGGKETGNRELLVRDNKTEGFKKGVPPQSDFQCFEEPILKYLDMNPEHQRGNAYKWKWDSPKVIFNKSTKSRGNWRIAAFADHKGIPCYQTYIGAWPKDELNIDVLAAILNSPLANAFVSTREGKTDITLETCKDIPLPSLNSTNERAIVESVNEYRQFMNQYGAASLIHEREQTKAELLLHTIDAMVLSAYNLPPKLERKLLDFFDGYERPVPFATSDYFDKGFEPYFSLEKYLSLSGSTAKHFREECSNAPNSFRSAVNTAVEEYGE